MKPFVSSKYLVFTAVFVCALMFEVPMWFLFRPTDDVFWVASAERFSMSIPPRHLDTMSVHPGTSILVPAGELISFGIPGDSALGITLAVLVAFLTALICVNMFILRPQSLWWIGAGVILSLNSLYIYITPPSAIATLLSVLWVILMLRAREKSTARLQIYLGMCAGVLLATRIDTGIITLALSLPYAWKILRSHIWLILAVAFICFYLADPYMWHQPLEHVRGIYQQIHSNVYHGISDWSILLALPMLGAFSICAFFSSRYIKTSPLPHDFFIWLLTITALVTLFYSLAKYHPLRYFVPIFACWEAFMPLYVTAYIESPSLGASSKYQRTLLQLAFIACVLCIRIVPFFFMEAGNIAF